MYVHVSYSKILPMLALFVTLLLPMTGSAGVATEVPLNSSVLLNLTKPSERVSIANPNIAELIVISPTQLQINGTRIGSTTLIVWDKGGATSFFDVRVKGDPTLLEKQIRDAAPNDRITVDYADDTIVLSGKAANEQTIKKVVQLARAYAVKDEGSRNGGQSSIQLLPVYGNFGNGAAKEAETEKEDSVKVINHIEIDDPQQVLLEVKVAQVDKAALRSLGLSFFGRGSDMEGFSNLVGAPSGELTIRDAAGNIISRATGIAGPIPGLANITPIDQYQLGVSFFDPGIGAVLRALSTKDMAKILAEPNLLVNSGQSGKFLAGSKIPITVVTGVGALSGTEIRYIDIGVKLNFRPVVMENDLIALKIDPAEVSSITGTLAVNGYPIIDTREVRTDVKLKNGESLVLAGLLQEEAIKTMSKIPLLGDIPILGALFRSTQDDLREKELVFFITPRIVKPNAPGTKPVLPTDEPLTPEQEREFKWVPMPG